MFYIADKDEIKKGSITDIYFKRTVQVLKKKGIDRHARAEVTLKGVPGGWKWGVLSGIEEVVELLLGLPVNVYSMREGTLFDAFQPVLVVEGRYLDYAIYETSLLGLLCQSSGVATKASYCKKAAGDRLVISFGARRIHPAIAPMIERSAFIGGCDGLAVIKTAKLLKEEAVGTIPHALILMFGDSKEATKAFHEVIEPKVKRVALVDTFTDEKFESIRVAEALGKRLFAVRLDTPSSRRGSMREILREVRWELDYRGYKHVKLLVSGGVDEGDILDLREFADGFGVGTAISGAPVIDFSFDIVEIDGKPLAKRGKRSGSKEVLRCARCKKTFVVPLHEKKKRCDCKGVLQPLLRPLLKNGKLVQKLPSPQEIKKYVLSQIKDREGPFDEDRRHR